MLNLKINKDKLKGLKRGIAMLSLATSLAMVSTGCSKETKEEEIGYEVMTNDSETPELYSYVIDERGFESENYSFGDFELLSLAKVVSEEKYDASNKATGFFRKNMVMIKPECYSLYGEASWINGFDMSIDRKEISTGWSTYDVVDYSMTAKSDLNLNIDLLPAEYKEINEGDTLSSRAIYYEGELVAYKQTGAGSESQNVIDGTIGDVDLALSTVEDYGLLDETEVVVERQLHDIEDSINDKEYIKRLK